MGNQPNSSNKGISNSNRTNSLNRLRPPPILNPILINSLKPPPKLLERELSPEQQPNPNPTIKKILPPIIENNRMLESNSISSYHFEESPKKENLKMSLERKEILPQTIKQKLPKAIPIDLNEFNDSNLDPAERFRLYLMKKSKNDMHLKFFREDPNLMYISLPILTQNKEKIIPLRNRLCKNTQCVYHIEDLINKYRESMFSSYLNFICYYCKTVIDLNNFYLDSTLVKIIEETWKKYNRVSLQCKEITLMRNGFWEPNLPEYLKLLEKNLSKTHKKQRVITNVDEVAQMKVADKKMKKLKFFEEFTLEEFKSLEEKLMKKKIKPEKKILYLENYAITFQDYLHLKSDSAFTVNLMNFFIQYIKEFQEKNYETYDKNSGNKTYIFGVKVTKFDKFYKRAKYEYLPGQSNSYKGKTSYLVEIYNLICLMILVENRWMILLIDLNTYDYYPIDFLNTGLTEISLQHLSELAHYIARKEFNINLKRLNVYNITKYDFLQDFGIYACYFFHKFLTNPDLVEISIETKEKNLFKKQFSWLILKHADILQKPVMVFEFARTKAEIEAEEIYEKERQLMRKRKRDLQKQQELEKEQENLKQNLEEEFSSPSISSKENEEENFFGGIDLNNDNDQENIENPDLDIDIADYRPSLKNITPSKRKSTRGSKKKMEFINNYEKNESLSQHSVEKEIKEGKTARINSVPFIILNKSSNRPSLANGNRPSLVNGNLPSLANGNRPSLAKSTNRPSISKSNNGGNSIAIDNYHENITSNNTIDNKLKSNKLKMPSTILNDQNKIKSLIPSTIDEFNKKSILPPIETIPEEQSQNLPSRKSNFQKKKSTIINEVSSAKLNSTKNMDNEIINITKEEFADLMNNFKDRIIKKVKAKMEGEETEMVNEDIKIEKNVVVMNKLHLKKILEEYENYLRNKFDDNEESGNELPQENIYNQPNFDMMNPENYQNPANFNGNPYYDDYYDNNQNENYEEDLLNAMTEDELKILLEIRQKQQNKSEDDSEDDSEDEKKSRRKKGKEKSRKNTKKKTKIKESPSKKKKKK